MFGASALECAGNTVQSIAVTSYWKASVSSVWLHVHMVIDCWRVSLTLSCSDGFLRSNMALISWFA